MTTPEMQALRTRLQAAQETVEALVALFDHSPDMIVAVDEGGSIHSANRTALRALGRDGALLGRAFVDLFDPRSMPHAAALVREARVDLLHPELTLCDGRVVSATAAPVPGRDTLQIALRDVTSKRVLEAEVQHSRRLAAIGHLAAGVAHEINNPLAVMQFRVELLAMRDGLPDGVADELRVVERHVQRIARIVRNLQTFAHREPAEHRAVPLVDILDAAQEVATLVLEGVDVVVSVDPPDLRILADAVQIEQVFVNLFTNSARAMGGHTGEIVVVGVEEQGFAHVTVEDAGPGFPADLLDDLFTPFVSGNEQTRGSGLGLAIAWGIIQEHGGSIRAGNPPLGGASMELLLPLATAGRAVRARRRSPGASRPLRILCVDDEPGLLKMVRAFADSAGHDVVGARSAEDALSLLDQLTFDAVLTDIHLPGASGLALRETIADRDPDLAERTIVMSGMFHRPDGRTRYLQKPFTVDQLRAALASVSDP